MATYPSTGRMLGHYRLQERIGEGGMGVVYRAFDERLQRVVAIKILPPGTLANEAARSRFRKEALALSKLNHPNIATIHDFDSEGGVDFLVMEYVAGMTVNEKLWAGPVAETELTEMGKQLAEGLAAAHAQGVIHRDLKPKNLRLTPDGRLKILDFGLAELAPAATEEAETESMAETRSLAGTLPYMAPEQLRGEPVDARSDIWAAGVVLYEMVTGRLPFLRKVPTATAGAILHEAVTPPARLQPSVSSQFEAIILKCLEKEPGSRYQSAKELAVDFKRMADAGGARAPAQAAPREWQNVLLAVVLLALAAAVAYLLSSSGSRSRPALSGAGSRIASLAVLPLENLSGDPAQEYFADGVTDELISKLARRSEELRVISRTSVMQYKGARKALPEIARELDVEAVVEGSVLRSGNKVRITAQLIRASDDRHLWAGSYNRDIRNVLDLQAEVAEAISRQIQVRLRPQEQGRSPGRLLDPDAYDEYLRGRFYWNRRNVADVREGLKHFRNAIARDANYAQAYAGVADSYLMLGPFLESMPPREALSQARVAVTKALELDPTLAEAHATLAQIALTGDWDWQTAETEFQKALDFNPGYATAHHWYGLYLGYLGRAAEARQQIQKARELDPLSLILQTNLGWTYYIERQYEKTVEVLQQVLQRDASLWVAHWGLGSSYVQQGRLDEGIAELNRAVELSARNSRAIASLAYAYARAGKRPQAERLLAELMNRSKDGQHIPAGDIAQIYLGLGQRDRALDWLEKAYVEHSQSLLLIKVDPWLDELRADARFGELLRRIGL
jgi:serine/threonine-protein kinase